MAGNRNTPCRLWVDTAISEFLTAVTQIGNADYFLFGLPVAGVAEFLTLILVAVNVSLGAKAVVQTETLP